MSRSRLSIEGQEGRVDTNVLVINLLFLQHGILLKKRVAAREDIVNIPCRVFEFLQGMEFIQPNESFHKIQFVGKEIPIRKPDCTISTNWDADFLFEDGFAKTYVSVLNEVVLSSIR